MAKDYSNETWQNTGYSPPCHASPKLAFRVGNLEVYGSRNSQVWREVWDLEMPFLESPTSDYRPLVLSQFNNEENASHFASWVREVRPTAEYIATVCADGSVPPLTADWWHGVANGLVSAAAAKTDGPYRVCVYCYGGHGRTGTALAILASILEATPAGENSVLWVRDQYCDEAIETQKQLDYIAKITGEDMKGVLGSYAASADKLTKEVPVSVAPGAGHNHTGAVVPFKTSYSYNYATTPYTNKALGATPPLGWQYVAHQNGTVSLQKLARKELKAIRRKGWRIATLPADYNYKGTSSSYDAG